MRPHCREEKRLRPVITQPVACRLCDFSNISNPATAGSDSHVAARHVQLQRIELLEYRRTNVRDRIRNQLLMYAQKSHGLGPFRGHRWTSAAVQIYGKSVKLGGPLNNCSRAKTRVAKSSF